MALSGKVDWGAVITVVCILHLNVQKKLEFPKLWRTKLSETKYKKNIAYYSVEIDLDS